MPFPIAGSQIFVTGGAGFVGSHVIDQLLAAGARKVVTVDNFVRGNRANVEAAQATGRFELVEGDIRDRALVDRLTEGADYVFHEAALRITACAADPREAHEVMSDGTFNVLEACVKHKVKKLVAASSASVYGEPDTQPIEEAAPYNNRTLYGAYKVMLEHCCRAFNEMYGLPYVALRYFNLYGPRMDMTGVYTEVMVRWMDRIDAGQPPVVFGTGDTAMDFIYITDCARANLLALESDASDVWLNVATGKDTSLLELCHLMLELMGRPELKPEFQEERKVNPVRRRRASTTKAAELLGFRHEIELRDGLRDLIAWRRAAKRG
ncbi:MAG: NAD-dependent epimerase/dehydratase family protein [Myxococcales bacterium]|nr:NAD-dependent epimerase/dehydratase family protein [Myxococcales bacterium]